MYPNTSQTMKQEAPLKISFGMITRDITTLEPLTSFLDNAARYGHELFSVVIAYSGQCDDSLIKELRSRIRVDLVKTGHVDALCEKFHNLGIPKSALEHLLCCCPSACTTPVPYGKNRNSVIIKALTTGVDVLIFVDTDVFPYLIVKDGTDVVRVDVDFVGRHKAYLDNPEVMITTSDYSGYFIIPPMRFDGMEALFRGVQKESAFEFIQDSYHHHCLVEDHHHQRAVFATNKILGGNVAIKLDVFRRILPFFSSVYEVRGAKYLTRGEDTLLGIEMSRSQAYQCIDIDTRIFHNTYGTYPDVPDILSEEKIRSRFFIACMGWIGRNPFMNWLNGNDPEVLKTIQLECLKQSAPKAAAHFKDHRFEQLPEALEIAYDNLPRVIEEYKEFAKSWKILVSKWDDWRGMDENLDD